MIKITALIFLVLTASSHADDCEDNYDKIDKYVPSAVTELLPLGKEDLCDKTFNKFRPHGDLAKFHDDARKRPESKQKSIPIEDYSFTSKGKFTSAGVKLDLAKENRAVSRALSYIREVAPSRLDVAIVVPGYSNHDSKTPTQLDPVARARVDMGVQELSKSGTPVIIFSGGNVHPKNTPYNEAFEMKQYAIKHHKVPEEMIAIDPYARHSTTNLRNAARFMFAHGLKKALIVTSLTHNFYFGYASRSSFEERAKKELGYSLGSLEIHDAYATNYTPAKDVMKKGVDPKDL